MATAKTTSPQTADTVKTTKPAVTQEGTKEETKVTTKNVANGLYQKILQAQKTISAVPKRGYNSFHKYHYATEADILSIKEILNDNGLVVLPTTQHQETGFKPDGKSWASVTLRFRVIDVESGETLESEFTGYAEDSFDKAIYKATTGANKYFYLKFFGIATEDDPEREDAAPRGDFSSKFTLRGSKADQPRMAPPQERPKAPVGNMQSPVNRNQALANANKILAFQKQTGLTNEEVLLYGEIDSIKVLAEAGDADKLERAYQRLVSQVQAQTAV